MRSTHSNGGLHSLRFDWTPLVHSTQPLAPSHLEVNAGVPPPYHPPPFSVGFLPAFWHGFRFGLTLPLALPWFVEFSLLLILFFFVFFCYFPLEGVVVVAPHSGSFSGSTTTWFYRSLAPVFEHIKWWDFAIFARVLLALNKEWKLFSMGYYLSKSVLYRNSRQPFFPVHLNRLLENILLVRKSLAVSRFAETTKTSNEQISVCFFVF